MRVTLQLPKIICNHFVIPLVHPYLLPICLCTPWEQFRLLTICNISVVKPGRHSNRDDPLGPCLAAIAPQILSNINIFQQFVYSYNRKRTTLCIFAVFTGNIWIPLIKANKTCNLSRPWYLLVTYFCTFYFHDLHGIWIQVPIMAHVNCDSRPENLSTGDARDWKNGPMADKPLAFCQQTEERRGAEYVFKCVS